MSLYDRIIAEDSRRTPSRERKWGTGPMSRRDIMSPKLRRLGAKALKRAGVHPTKSSPEEVEKVLSKDPAYNYHATGVEIRTMTRNQRPPSAGEKTRGGGDKCWGACLLRRRGQKVKRRA